jgi:uncharacterized Zn finger protein
MSTASAVVVAKSKRLLVGGQVQVKFASELGVTAAVRGDSGVYDVRWDRNGGRWACSCAAFGDCSHIEAVRSITVRTVAEASS